MREAIKKKVHKCVTANTSAVWQHSAGTPASLLLLAARQEPYKNAYFLTKNIGTIFKKRFRRMGQQAENDKTERVTGLGRRTREEIAKWQAQCRNLSRKVNLETWNIIYSHLSSLGHFGLILAKGWNLCMWSDLHLPKKKKKKSASRKWFVQTFPPIITCEEKAITQQKEKKPQTQQFPASACPQSANVGTP